MRQKALAAVSVGAAGLCLFTLIELRGAQKTEAPAAPPSVRFEPMELDFGDQPWHIDVPFELVLVNDRSQTVTLAGAQSSCGCTVIERERVAGVQVGPRQRYTIPGFISTETAGGIRERSVTVHLSDGTPCVARMRMNVIRSYRFEPEMAAFGRVVVDGPHGAGVAVDPEMSLRFESLGPLMLAEPEVDSRWLHARIDEAGGGIVIQLNRRLLPTGPSYGRINVLTDDPYVPEWSIPVSFEVGRQLEAVPSHLFVRDGAPQTARIVAADGTEVSILGVTPSEPAIQVRLLDNTSLEASCDPGATLSAQPILVNVSEGRSVELFVTCFSTKG